MFFDTHAHLDDEHFADDRELVIKRAREAGLQLIMNASCNLEACKKTIELTKKYDFIYGAVGIHPQDARDITEVDFSELKELAGEEKIRAIGEIGLDYYWDDAPHDVQHQIFRRQINLAKEVKLPVIIHDREAHQDVFEILKEEGAQEVGGVMHCYSGSWEMAKEYIKLGFYISLGGPVTFKNGRKVQEIAKQVPLENLLIETDSPYLAPVPYRGKRNEPAYVVKTAEQIAHLKGIGVEVVAKATLENGKKLFNI